MSTLQEQNVDWERCRMLRIYISFQSPYFYCFLSTTTTTTTTIFLLFSLHHHHRHHISIVFPPSPPPPPPHFYCFPPPPHLYCFPSTTTTTTTTATTFLLFPSTTTTTKFVLFSLHHHHHHHISIIFFLPTPPHFYCFPSTTTRFLLFSLHHHRHHISIVFLHHHNHLISIVFAPRDSIRDYQLPFWVHFVAMSRVVNNNRCFLQLLADCPTYQRQFLTRFVLYAITTFPREITWNRAFVGVTIVHQLHTKTRRGWKPISIPLLKRRTKMEIN